MSLVISSSFPTVGQVIDIDGLNSALKVGAGDISALNSLGAFANQTMSYDSETNELTFDNVIDNVNKDSLLNFVDILKTKMPTSNDGVVKIMQQYNDVASAEDYGYIVDYDTDAYKVAPVTVDFVKGNYI